MKNTVLLLITLSAYFSHAQNVAENFNASTQQNVIAERRYSTSVVHQDPNNPSQSAKSVIHVDFSPEQYKTPRHIAIGQNSNSEEPTKSKSSQDYGKNQYDVQTLQGLRYYQPPNTPQTPYNQNVQILQQPTQQISIQQPTQQISIQKPTQQMLLQQSTQQITYQQPTQQISTNQQQAQHNHNIQFAPDSQMQLFNVGYSVSFKNEPPKPTPKQPPPKLRNLDGGEIITGTRKGFVSKPDFVGSPTEYVETALINNSKLRHTSREDDNDSTKSNQQILLSPITQKYLSELKTPSTSASFAQYQHDVTLKQDMDIITASQKPSWENLSPTLEIFRSTEMPSNKQQHFSTQLFEAPKQAQHFDHAKALGKSQGFDYTNAIDGGNLKQLVAQPNSYYDISKYATAADLVYPQHDKKVISSQQSNSDAGAATPVATTQFQQQVNFLTPQYEKLIALPTTGNEALNKPLTIDLFGGQGSYQNQRNDASNAPTTDIRTNPTTVPKLPLDTSLLRNPVLTNGKTESSDPKLIPIQFDTRLLEQALHKNLLDQNQNNYQLSSDFTNHLPNYPNLNPQELYKRTPDTLQQPQQKYKMHLKPQSSYNMKYPNRSYKSKEDYMQRQPRYHSIRSIRPMNKEFGQTRLRPPPYAMAYKRRMHTAFK